MHRVCGIEEGRGRMMHSCQTANSKGSKKSAQLLLTRKQPVLSTLAREVAKDTHKKSNKSRTREIRHYDASIRTETETGQTKQPLIDACAWA